jgi:hypothetical protein
MNPLIPGLLAFTLEVDRDVKYSPNHALDNKTDCTFALTRKESLADFEHTSIEPNFAACESERRFEERC